MRTSRHRFQYGFDVLGTVAAVRDTGRRRVARSRHLGTRRCHTCTVGSSGPLGGPRAVIGVAFAGEATPLAHL